MPSAVPGGGRQVEMDQQERGSGAQPVNEDPSQEQARAEGSANDSTWGLGSASALDNLRRQEFRVRRSKPAEDQRPASD